SSDALKAAKACACRAPQRDGDRSPRSPASGHHGDPDWPDISPAWLVNFLRCEDALGPVAVVPRRGDWGRPSFFGPSRLQRRSLLSVPWLVRRLRAAPVDVSGGGAAWTVVLSNEH